MFLISHRGNLYGKDSSLENHPSHILEVLYKGYDCEIDVWKIFNNFFLGHDEPTYKVDKKFLRRPGLWCHAKNLEALTAMTQHKQIHCFWHQTDNFTLTSRGYIWTFQGEDIQKKSIIVNKRFGEQKENIPLCAGICSDYIGKIKT